MRSDSTSTRVAITTLYIRVRESRRHSRAVMERHGADSQAYIAADAQHIATWNALQAVQAGIGRGPLRTQPGEFVRLVAQGARVRRDRDARAVVG